MKFPAISEIVPGYCEVENLPALVPRIAAALAIVTTSCEILVVDDASPDQTGTVCRRLANTYPLRLLVRHGQRDLAAAVLHGMPRRRSDASNNSWRSVRWVASTRSRGTKGKEQGEGTRKSTKCTKAKDHEVLRGGRISGVGSWQHRPAVRMRFVYFVYFLVVTGCHGDVNRLDRQAARDLRRIGARLETDEQGFVVEVLLSNTRTNDEDLRFVQGLQTVRSLRLENTHITDAGLQHVQHVTTLENLSLYRTHVTSAGLEYVRGLSELRSLGLNRTEVNDYGLHHLVELRKLESLWLDGAPISDAGLPALAKLKQLQHLGLRETHVSPKGGEMIQRSLRETTVYLDETQP
jgi:hypothetical protein